LKAIHAKASEPHKEFSKSATQVFDDQPSSQIQRHDSKFHIYNRVKHWSQDNQAKNKEANAEQEKKKADQQKTIDLEKNDIKEAEEIGKAHKQLLDDLKHKRISHEEYASLTSTSDKKVLPQINDETAKSDEELAKLKKNKEQKERDVQAIFQPSKTFPLKKNEEGKVIGGGSQHARRDPLSGHLTHHLTKSELYKNPNFVQFYNGEPIFLQPDDPGYEEPKSGPVDEKGNFDDKTKEKEPENSAEEKEEPKSNNENWRLSPLLAQVDEN